MAHSIVPKNTLKQAEISSKRLIRYGILTICSDTDISQTSEKVRYTQISTNIFINGFIKDLEEATFNKVSIFDTKTTQETIYINNHTIMKKICLWCDQSEVDIIFIIGSPCDFSSERIGYSFFALKEMVTKTFENIIDEHAFKKYPISGPNIKKKLKFKYNRVMCGERNEKLIINLFGAYERTVNCLDITLKTLNYYLKWDDAQNEKVKQNIASCSSNPFSDQVYHEHKVNDHKALSSVTNIFNLPNWLKNCSNFLINLFHKVTKLFAANQDDIYKKSLLEVMDKMELEDIIPNTQYDMITIEKALSLIHEKALNEVKEFEQIGINIAFGRILCESVRSKCNVPAFRVSTNHGYAVLANDKESWRIVVNKTTADPISLSPGTCMWVKSGDRVPDEATAVVKVNDVRRIVNHEAPNNLILIMIKPEIGQNIKDVGSDIPENKLILTPHIRIGSAELGLLAATDWEEVLVAKRISVGVLSIGDLLEDPNNSLKPGYVYDSSRISLIALLKEKGSMLNPILNFGIVAEDEKFIMDKINAALKKVDVLVIIGCVNDHDALKTILRDHLGASIHFGNVNVKPGKSTTFATCKVEDKTKYLLCLSGNPASTLISAQLFLIPLLDELCCNSKSRQKMPVYINQQYALHPRPRVAWSSLQWNIHEKTFANAFGKKNVVSDKLFSSQGANALLMLPAQKADHFVMESSAFVSAFSVDPN